MLNNPSSNFQMAFNQVKWVERLIFGIVYKLPLTIYNSKGIPINVFPKGRILHWNRRLYGKLVRDLRLWRAEDLLLTMFATLGEKLILSDACI